jgi:DNA-binding PadR family transcriptional regulator
MELKTNFGLAGDPQLLILVSLADALSKRTYRIVLDIPEFSGCPVIHRRRIYLAAAQLVDKGLITIEQRGRDEAYSMTEAGRTLLETELKSMQRVAAIGLQRLGYH